MTQLLLKDNYAKGSKSSQSFLDGLLLPQGDWAGRDGVRIPPILGICEGVGTRGTDDKGIVVGCRNCGVDENTGGCGVIDELIGSKLIL